MTIEKRNMTICNKVVTSFETKINKKPTLLLNKIQFFEVITMCA